MSLALARKYRPKNFASVAVQSHVSNTLKGAIARGRVAHGYLLCGPRGTGKTTLARVLAMALNCENRRDDGEPCGACDSCRRIWSGSSSLDVVEIDAASNRSVDDARELRERAMYAPSGDDRYKVYIVDEAHMLTREAWNALLKILEEPPPRVVFVFATTEPQKIAQSAAPILSRLQRFDLRRIGPAEIRDRLAAVLDAEGVPYEEEALGMIARSADGGLRDALSLTDQVLSLGADARVTAERVGEALGLVPEDEYVAILDLIAERRAADVFATVAHLADSGVDFALFLAGLGDVLRALLATSLGGSAPGTSERLRAALAERRERFQPADLLRMLNVLVDVEPRFRRSGQQQLLLETLLVRFALLDRAVDLEDVLRGLGSGGGSGGGSGDGAGGGASGGAARGGSSPAGGSGGRPPAAYSAASVVPPVAPAPASAPAPRASAPAAPTWGANAPGPSSSPTPRASAPPQMLRDGSSIASAPSTSAAAPSGGGATAVLDAPPRAVAAPAPPPAAAAAPAGAPAAVVDPSVLAERWDVVVEHLRSAGRLLVASAMQSALPVAVAATGAVTVQLDEPNAAYVQALEQARDDVLAALRRLHPGATRVIVREPAAMRNGAPQRVTTESVKAERVTGLVRRDPVLGAAIEALDLELLE